MFGTPNLSVDDAVAWDFHRSAHELRLAAKILSGRKDLPGNHPRLRGVPDIPGNTA